MLRAMPCATPRVGRGAFAARIVLALTALLFARPCRGVADEAAVPTRAQVLDALRTFRTGPPDTRGETRIRQWGDRALPVLRELAVSGEGFEYLPQICSSLDRVGTPAAADLTVELLESGHLHLAMTVLPLLNLDPGFANPNYWEHLRGHAGFQGAVWQHGTGPFRGRVADISARMGWRDSVPKIRALIEDPDYAVRRAAAAALRVLTGEPVGVRRPALAFPAVDERPGLFGEPVALPKRGFTRADFVTVTPWFDDEPRIACAFRGSALPPAQGGELRLFTSALLEAGTWPIPVALEALERLPTRQGRIQVVGLIREGRGAESWDGVVAWAADGSERWRRRLPERFLKSIAPLYGEAGCEGMAVLAGGATGIVGLDLDGATRWELPRQLVLSELSTHPRLPGWLLAVGSGTKLVRHGEGVARVQYSDPYPPRIHTRLGVLFPNAEGGPAAVVAGNTLQTGVPTLRRLDAQGQGVWEATLPASIEGLALIEPEGAPRLLALTTLEGDLLLVDDGGTLRWRGKLPDAEPGEEIATYQLVAGRIAKEQHGVIVRLLRNSYLYRLDPDAFGPPRAR